MSEETAAMYKQEVTTDSTVDRILIMITDPDTGIEMPSEEAIAKGIVTKEEVEEILRMKDEQEMRGPKSSPSRTPSRAKGPASLLAASTSTLGRASSRKGSSSESSSSCSISSDDDENDRSSSSYRSELTIEIDKNAPGSQGQII